MQSRVVVSETFNRRPNADTDADADTNSVKSESSQT